jgi:serine/threonine protein phosphatase PrpC
MQLGPKAATAKLIELANQRGGRDNITSVAVELR